MIIIKSDKKGHISQKTNKFGDQIIEIKDLNNKLLLLRYKEEGNWFSEIELNELFKMATTNNKGTCMYQNKLDYIKSLNKQVNETKTKKINLVIDINYPQENAFFLEALRNCNYEVTTVDLFKVLTTKLNKAA